MSEPHRPRRGVHAQPGARTMSARRLAVPAAIGAMALVLAGCADTAATGATVSTAGAAAATSGTLSEASLKTIAGYTGSTLGKADASLAPVTWGLVNQEGGALNFPQYTQQSQALADVVNNQLGGIGGHPLKLDVCKVVSSDEEGQACGQQFANDAAISTIIEFPLINGNSSFHRVVDPTGIPVFGSSASSPKDVTPTTDFFTTGPNFDTVPVLTGYTVDKLKAKTVALIGIEGEPVSQLVTGMLKTGFESAGVAVKLATISATSSDVTAPLIAAGVQQSDAIVALLPTTSLCSNVAGSLKSLGATSTPVVTIAQCASADVKSVLGDYPQWTFLSGYPLKQTPPLSERETAELAVANELWTSVGAKPGDDTYASPTTQVMLTALAMVNKAGAGDATKEKIVAAAQAYEGALWLGPDKINWGFNPALPGLATSSERLFTYTGDNTWLDSGGGWYSPTVAPPS